jgi:hypothetical protein
MYIIDVNLQRRQLTSAQRIQLSLKQKPILEELAKRYSQMNLRKGTGVLVNFIDSGWLATDMGEPMSNRIGEAMLGENILTSPWLPKKTVGWKPNLT